MAPKINRKNPKAYYKKYKKTHISEELEINDIEDLLVLKKICLERPVIIALSNEVECPRLSTPDCIICLESLDIHNNQTIVTKNGMCSSYMGLEYITTCNCRVNLHKTCMTNWMQNNQRCPICRTMMRKYEGWAVEHKLKIQVFWFLCIWITISHGLIKFIVYILDIAVKIIH